MPDRGLSHPGGLRLETPEGIDVEIRPAGPVVRGLAISIDATVTTTLSIVAGLLFSPLSEAGVGLYLLVYFVVEWFYPVLFEVLNQGRTPGKIAMGLRVVSADATPIGWNDSVLRNLLRVVDFLPFFYLTGLVALMIGGRFQRLGDLAARTLVVHAPSRPASAASRVAAEEPSDAEALGATRLPIPLPATEQRAIVAWSERQSVLSDARSVELADLLSPLTGAQGEDGRVRLRRIANGILGAE